MERTLIKEVRQHTGETVKICGFADKIRIMKRNQFLIVRDHTGKVQVYIDSEKYPTIAELVSKLTPESTVEVMGIPHDNKNVKLGGVEISPIYINIVSMAEVPLPITELSTSDARQNWRYIDLRSFKNYLIFQVQTTAENAMREFWIKNGFIEIHSPKLIGTASESGSEVFKLQYFNREAYLAQSPQFYKQMAMSAGFDKVFEIGPVFRANPSFTSRHDTEFVSIDAEMSWITSHYDVMKMEEKWIEYFLTAVKKQWGEKIQEVYDRQVIIPTVPFPRVSLQEAKEILATLDYTALGEDDDLDPEGERMICKYFKEKTGHEFLFVTDYPVSVRPFYHMRNAFNSKLTKSYDLLWNGIEVTTGAQREHRYDILKEQILDKGLSLEPLQFYLDFFKYGSVPHGGYGFGLTRMLMKLFGLNNVRQVTYLYRGPNRLNP